MIFGTIREFLVTEDGGLTTPGYIVCIVAAVLALGLAIFISKKKKKEGMDARVLVFCGVSVALAYVLSFVKVIPLPFGGSVTLCSMLFVCIVGYWYGLGTGMLVAFVYGMLQFLQSPYILSFFQICCDYLLAFACLGLTGLFHGKKNGLIIGYLIAVMARGAFHSLGGYLFWMEYMPDNFPVALAWAYPIVYNYMYILAEAAITIILLLLPPVKKGISQITKLARGE